MSSRQNPSRDLRGEEGFTMLFALLALFVGALLVAAAFTAANGDIKLTHRATLQQKAYYAALAGIDRYQYQLTSSPEYWTKCPTIGSQASPLKVTGTSDENYYVKTLASGGRTACESGKQATILETSGAAKGTFRILSTGTVSEGSSTITRKIVATFTHPGFTKYVYESNYEVEDPVNFGLEPKVCEYYYAERVAKGLTGKCPPIQFAPEDQVNGPMHTNDAAQVCTSGGHSPTFGREGYNDEIEMNGGHYAASGCLNTPNIIGKYTEKAGSVLPPETDIELLEAAGKKYDGRTEIELKEGSPNTMKVTNKGTTETIPFPSNGVVYVENSKTETCGVAAYTPFGTDTVGDTGCGNVYVHGKYTESLTIASADDVIVNGNLTTTEEENGEPTGAATLGLIAENFVRVYHPVKESTTLPTKQVTGTETATSEEIATETCGTGYVKRTGTLVSENTRTTHKKEIKEISSMTGVSVGMTVIGAYIPSETTVTAKGSTTVELSEYPTKSGVREEVWFYKPATNGYEYAPTLKKCVEPAPSGYTYHESENLFVKGSCESGTEYIGNGVCQYEFTTGNCPSKATNLNATEDPNHWGSLENLVIDAAILSTRHSWIVDNYKCGATLGSLTVWGSIAQFWRGPVGQSGSPGHGYIKNYNYDNRLANQQPPSFLNPTSASSWKISRETAPPTSFTG
ncbi:MAG TPA: hypothetical protein VL988_01445 [Solirubrobacteraceae bacterium]|nr:hypothetical protein [Solirubrobacteraceae bacterium]